MNQHVNIKALREALMDYFAEDMNKGDEEAKACYEAVRDMGGQALCAYAEAIGVNMKRFMMSV